MKVGHKNELNFKIKALRTNLNQEMRNKNEKLCKTTEVMGLELRYLGIYVVLLTRKRTHNDIMHGLRTPNEGINQRYLKNVADVADKTCFGRT